jgi:hypothetical protein
VSITLSLRLILTHEARTVPLSKLGRFGVLYYAHALTTVPVPLALLVLGIVTPLEALSIVLLLAGFWTLVGGLMMASDETRQLRKWYTRVGIALVLLSAAPLL